MNVPCDPSLDILVVDDEAPVRSFLSQLLEQCGSHRVSTADNGQSALDLLETRSFDCAFVDFMMPGISGLELLDHIMSRAFSMSVIIITGYPSMEVVIDAMRRGAVDFLTKPFGVNEIRLALQRLLREQRWIKRNEFLSHQLAQKQEVEKLNRELEKRSREQALLYRIVDTLSNINQSEDLYSRLVQLGAEVTDAKKCWFTIFNETRSHLMTIAEQGVGTEHLGSRFSVTHDNGTPEVSLAEIPHLRDSERRQALLPVGTLHRLNRLITVPITIRTEPFGVLWVSLRRNGRQFTGEDEFSLRFVAEKASLAIENIALYENIRENLVATLRSLVSAIEAKDSYTEQHSKRVTDLAIDIAEVMNRTPEEIESLHLCGTLHDIGKIGIKDTILNKPGRLTEEEFAAIKTHPVIGDRIVRHLGLRPEERAIVRNHHERWDGKGYPDGLRGEENPLLARILSVADAFDAMTSDRTYRRALSVEVTKEEFRRNRGSQFDPEPVDALLYLLEKKPGNMPF
jgi:putative nucleotidyltransferase with HDIG domain